MGILWVFVMENKEVRFFFCFWDYVSVRKYLMWGVKSVVRCEEGFLDDRVFVVL